MNARHLILIDADSRRRAEAASTMARHNIAVAPLEDMTELTPGLIAVEAFLVFDFPGIIKALLDWMGDNDFWRPIIAYAPAPTIAGIVSAINEGANDYLPWPLSPSKLLYSIDKLGNLTNSPGEQKARARRAQRKIDVLTRRERETLVLVAKGFSSRIIGQQLNISARTVEVFRASGLKKLGVDSMIEATQIVFEAGLANEPTGSYAQMH